MRVKKFMTAHFVETIMKGKIFIPFMFFCLQDCHLIRREFMEAKKYIQV